MIRLLPDQGFEFTYPHGLKVVVIWGFLSKTENEHNVDVSPFESTHDCAVESDTIEYRVYNKDGVNITGRITNTSNDYFTIMSTNLPILLKNLYSFDDDNYGQIRTTQIYL